MGAKFVIESGPAEPERVVTLRTDGGDVDILVDGILVAWLDGGKGKLGLSWTPVAEQVEGLQYDVSGRIKVIRP
jgi:hypothetical protein